MRFVHTHAPRPTHTHTHAGASFNTSRESPCLQIRTSGQISVLRLSNLSSLDHNSKISCTAENIVGEKESSLLLDILCTFPT